jgi:hypothetical protein
MFLFGIALQNQRASRINARASDANEQAASVNERSASVVARNEGLLNLSIEHAKRWEAILTRHEALLTRWEKIGSTAPPEPPGNPKSN